MIVVGGNPTHHQHGRRHHHCRHHVIPSEDKVGSWGQYPNRLQIPYLAKREMPSDRFGLGTKNKVLGTNQYYPNQTLLSKSILITSANQDSTHKQKFVNTYNY